MTIPRHPTVHIETHGCKLNQADSQELARRFVRAGYQVAQEPHGVDVYVVNTCTVTHTADRKARQALRNARRRHPEALVVATGCYAQRAPEQLGQVAGVGLVVGNTEKEWLVDRVAETLGLREVACSTGSPMPLEKTRAPRTRAMVKIQEGCDQVCAYCIVPKVRGRERSGPSGYLVERVRHLVEEGHQEVVLTGTQLGTYGFDIPGASLFRLVERVLLETGVRRLRVSSLQPQELTDELLDLWRNPRLCPHFHLPLQSGSREILSRMRRRYTPRQYAQAVEAIERRVPNAAITADVIVGFPGETEAMFRETYRFCQGIGYAGLHVFPYSPRPGTSAAHFGEGVEERVKRERMSSMLALAKERARRYRRGMLGTARPVLWESCHGVGEATVWSGLTDNYIRVAVACERALENSITPVVLERQAGEVVWGRLTQAGSLA